MPEDVDKARYTHARMAIHSEPHGGVFKKICPDSGASETIVSRSFLHDLQHTVQPAQRSITGIGGSAPAIRQRAIFEFYIDGLEDGKATTRKFTHTAWVYPDELAPNILLGTDFMKPHGGKMDYDTGVLTLGHLNDFTVPFQTQLKGYAVI